MVRDALKHELDSMPDVVKTSTLAAAALELAKQLDSSVNGGTSKSMIAKELRETMRTLHDLAPPKQEESELDRRRRDRDERLARQAAAGPAGPS